MTVRVLYFAGLKEALGVAGENVEPPAEVATLGQLRDWLASAGGRAHLATASHLKGAVNQQMSGWETPLKEGDEVAFFPPVTGG